MIDKYWWVDVLFSLAEVFYFVDLTRVLGTKRQVEVNFDILGYVSLLLYSRCIALSRGVRARLIVVMCNVSLLYVDTYCLWGWENEEYYL